jgi:hypothetical protein
MLDRPLRKLIEPAAAPVSRWFVRFPSDALIALAFLAGLGAFAAIAARAYWWGLALVVVNRAFAGLYNLAAKPADRAGRGGFFELVLDAVFSASVPFAFALADPSRALAASFLILGFAVANAAYFAFGMMAASRNTAASEIRAVLFPGGLVERSETFVALAIACVMPQSFGVVAYVLGILCFLTAGMRVAEAFAAFKTP